MGGGMSKGDMRRDCPPRRQAIVDHLSKHPEAVRILLAGAPGAGKSSLINTFISVVEGERKFPVQLRSRNKEGTAATTRLRSFPIDEHGRLSVLDLPGLPLKTELQKQFFTGVLRGIDANVEVPLGALVGDEVTPSLCKLRPRLSPSRDNEVSVIVYVVNASAYADLRELEEDMSGPFELMRCHSEDDANEGGLAPLLVFTHSRESRFSATALRRFEAHGVHPQDVFIIDNYKDDMEPDNYGAEWCALKLLERCLQRVDLHRRASPGDRPVMTWTPKLKTLADAIDESEWGAGAGAAARPVPPSGEASSTATPAGADDEDDEEAADEPAAPAVREQPTEASASDNSEAEASHVVVRSLTTGDEGASGWSTSGAEEEFFD